MPIDEHNTVITKSAIKPCKNLTEHDEEDKKIWLILESLLTACKGTFDKQISKINDFLKMKKIPYTFQQVKLRGGENAKETRWLVVKI